MFVNCFFTREFKDDATDSSPLMFFVFFSSRPDDDDADAAADILLYATDLSYWLRYTYTKTCLYYSLHIIYGCILLKE